MTKTYLLTGTSSGLGLALAHELLSRNENVIATYRHTLTSSILSLQEKGARILELDMNDPEEILVRKVSEAKGIFEGGIDVLINCAGVFEWGLVEKTRAEEYTKMFQTNVLAPITLTRSLLPHFRAKKSGKIVFVGSENGWRGSAGLSNYSLGKFALEGFVESLQKEVVHLGIETIIFEPGEFRTGILGKAKSESVSDHDPDYGEMVARIRKGLGDSDGKQKGDPRKGARVMVDVINGEGVAMGKVMPGRLPLGRECLETVRRKCVETLRLCDEWEEVIGSTEFDDVVV